MQAPQLQQRIASHQGASCSGRSASFPISCRRGLVKARADIPGSILGDASAWGPDNLNRRRIAGPGGQPESPEVSDRGVGFESLGARGYERWTAIKREERQRVWDCMREAAKYRYDRGQMPDWFDPKWLTYDEAPVNTILREMGAEGYQYNDTWLGRPFNTMPQDGELELAGSGGDDSNNNGNRGGTGSRKGWWREDDPYWMLRDWGDHPMRWWTLAYGAVLAVGGLTVWATTSSHESLIVGCAAGAWLALCSLAMSDMRHDVHGEFGVKMAFGACAAIALKDGIWGWAHLPGSGSRAPSYYSPRAFEDGQQEPPPWEWLIPKIPLLQLSAGGWAAAGMCALYMVTGMGDALDGSLPANPGSVYKSSDVVLKHRVWERWGYGDATMRP